MNGNTNISNTSCSNAVCLNFSDGIKTVYTKSAQINIPFEVEYIRVANIYLSSSVGGSSMNAIITSNLVDNDVIATGRQYTSTKPLKHYYQIPRPINGSYDFSINLSNNLQIIPTTSRIGYEAVGTILTGTNTITFTAGDNIFFNFVEDDLLLPNPGRVIRTGAGPYIGGTNSFTVISWDSGTNVMVVTPVAAGDLNNVDWFMDGNLLTVNPDNALLTLGSFSNEYDPSIIITKKISAGRYRLNNIVGYEGLNAIDFYTPNLYLFHDLTQCQVVLDLEFYKKVSIPRVIQNTQYYLWNSSSFNDIKNIDVLFPVDEIRVVNFNIVGDDTVPLTTIVGFSSDLVQSSILTNENYLTFNSVGSGNYQVNKKKYEYPAPRIINGSYKINANYMFTGLPFDLAPNSSAFYFHFLFISYRKE